MEHGLKVLALVALILPGVAGAIDRSNSCTVKQDPIQGSWTVYGTIEAKGIDPSHTYTGYLGLTGVGVQFVNTVYTVGPTNRRFREESPGLYRVQVTLTKTAVIVEMQGTQYGPLEINDYGTYQTEGGQFECILNIADVTPEPDTVIHTAHGREYVWFYR